MQALKRGLQAVRGAGDPSTPHNEAHDDVAGLSTSYSRQRGATLFEREALSSPRPRRGLAVVRAAALVASAPLLEGVSGSGSAAAGAAMVLEIRLLDAMGAPKVSGRGAGQRREGAEKRRVGGRNGGGIRVGRM